MMTLIKVLFMGEQHEGVTVGRLSNAYKWHSFFKGGKSEQHSPLVLKKKG